MIIDEIKHQIAVIIRDSGNITENLFKSLLKKPFVGIFLHFDKIRHFKSFIYLSEAHTGSLTELHRLYIHHRRTPPHFV